MTTSRRACNKIRPILRYEMCYLDRDWRCMGHLSKSVAQKKKFWLLYSLYFCYLIFHHLSMQISQTAVYCIYLLQFFYKHFAQPISPDERDGDLIGNWGVKYALCLTKFIGQEEYSSFQNKTRSLQWRKSASQFGDNRSANHSMNCEWYGKDCPGNERRMGSYKLMKDQLSRLMNNWETFAIWQNEQKLSLWDPYLLDHHYFSIITLNCEWFTILGLSESIRRYVRIRIINISFLSHKNR